MDRTIARIEKDMLRRVGRILLEIQDPHIAAGLVAVSKTQISRDLRVLKCYVTVNHGPAEQEAVLLALHKARKFVRGRLGENLTLRYTPEIRFYLDDTPESASRIDRILDSLAPAPAEPENEPAAEAAGEGAGNDAGDDAGEREQEEDRAGD